MAAVSRLSYVVAGFLLCTLLLLTPTGAHAQTSQVLVSNFGQGGATTSGSEHGLAQGFRTGNNTAGYRLTSIELLLGVQTGASPFPTVTLHSGSPTGSKVADFTAPSSATGAAVYTFIPTTTVTLEMNTDYWVVATGGTIGWVWSVTGPGEDATSATGWSIANRAQWFDPDSGSWKDANGDYAFHITANGYEPAIVTTELSADFPESRFTSKRHTGSDDRPQVVVTFSKPVASFDRNTPSVSVTGASGLSVQALTEDGLENAYIFFMTPDGNSDVTFALTTNAACASGGICTAGGTVLTQVPAPWTIPGPSGDSSSLSVADAEATEEEDSTLDFVVTLDPAASDTVTVEYATSDGTAAAGEDYTATSGTLTFQAGEVTKTISVPITDDAEDDGGETFTLTLSNASGAEIEDATATGTFRDTDTPATPTVTAVALTSAPGSDNIYAIGDSVEATVTFSAAVDISGSPQLELDFAGTAKAATCATGTNTTTMACSYTVLVGEEAPNGVAIAANKLTGGTIYATGSTTVSADLDHDAVAIDAGHTVDGIRPTLLTTGTNGFGSNAPTTSPDGTKIILFFSEVIGGVDRTKITVKSGTTTQATPVGSVSSGPRLEIRLASALTSADTAVTVELGADAVTDVAGNGILAVAATTVTNAVVTTTAPTVSGVALTSDPGSDDTYAIGDAVAATVTFDAAVDISGSPQLELDFAGTAKAATCATGTNTTTMACSYTVLVGEEAPNGVAIAANKLTGGTIYATGSTTVSADLDHDAVAIDAGHTVDGIRPTLLTTGTNALGSNAPTTSPDGTKIILFFSEVIGGVDRAKITVKSGTTTQATPVGSVSSGPRLEIRLASALTSADTAVTVELGADAVTDVAGNGIAAVAPTSVTAAELSADFPESAFTSKRHTGSDDRPQVVVTFSKRVASFDRNTPSVSVTGASGLSVQAHTEDGLENAYIFFMTPDGNSDVTFALTTNAACASGGICTAGGTVLTQVPAPWTIPGPSGDSSSLSVADAEATEEEDSTLDFVVTLDPAASDTVTVEYATSDGTAAAGEDYTATSGTLTFSAGTTSKTISVSISDDSENESDETFTVTLSNASGADLGTSSATGTIKNRLVVIPNVSISGGSGTEGDDDDIDFTVTLDQAATGTVTVDYATSDGSADAGDDYTAKSGTLTFSAGTTSKTISVAIEDDVENESDETFTVTLSNPSGADLGTSSATGTIENRYVAPLTARFENMPSEHDGSEFTFELHFSESPEVPYRRLRDRSFTLVQADVIMAQRQNPQAANKNQSWTITVEPLGTEEISITLPAAVSCTDDKSICAHDGRKLSHATSATVAGPPSISVSDATVTEAAGAVLAFTVSLSRSSGSNVTVDYATSDGTATAGADYTAASGTLTIGAGSTSGSIDVTVLDDSHDDGGETLTLTLSNASNGVLGDATATGTIENSDPLPKALMARFGRTAALHVVEQVEERVNAPRQPGFDGRLAGRQVNGNMGRDFALDFLRQLGGGAGYTPMGTGQPVQGPGGAATGGAAMGHAGGAPVNGGGLTPMGAGGVQPMQPPHGPDGMGMSLGHGSLLTGSGFALNRVTKTGGILSFWSRSAQSQFHGREGVLALNGDVRTTMFGADYSKGRMVTGLSLSHSRGRGSYAGIDNGRVTSAVTGLYPWIGYKASERVTVWTVAGYGAGGLLLNPGAGTPVETGLSMAMAAGGGRGQILGGGEGFGLAFKADALWVGTRTDESNGPGGRLRGTSAAVNRLRTALEGSQSMELGGRMALTPSVEVGIRQDGGDAETGTGMDVGAGLVFADAVTGLSVDVRVRTLVVHQADGFAERGVSISVSYNPTPSSPLGFTARVSPAWGGDSMSGAEALWGRETMGGMGGNHLLGGGGNRLDTEVGYGLPIGARFVGTPRAGVRTSEYGRDYRVGYGMQVLEQGRLNLELGIDAERRESPVFHLQEGSAGTDQRVLGRATVHW